MQLWNLLKWFKKPLPSMIVQQLVMRQFPPILVVRLLNQPSRG
jgi:hypothetical protein